MVIKPQRRGGAKGCCAMTFAAEARGHGGVVARWISLRLRAFAVFFPECW